MIGKVKWFDNKHGYGFIEVPGHPDIFVHYSSIKGKGYRVLQPEDEVSFRMIESEKGPQAMDVLVISDEEIAGNDKNP